MLSVIINTKNAAETLARTLESVQFADEIVVVDQHSRDATREIAQHHNAKVFLFDDLGRVEPEARNFALSKANKPWVLVLDADEVVPVALARKIKSIISQSESDTVGYYLPRRNLIFNAWIKHSGWWPDYQLRLFQKDKAHWLAGVHSSVKVDGLVEKLPAEPVWALVHHNYRTVSQFLQKLDRYSGLRAEELGSLDRENKAIATEMIEAFSAEWFRRLFYNQAYLDGSRGIALAYLQSMHELAVKLKRWEITDFKEEQSDQSTQVIFSLEQFRRQLNYWLADYQFKHTSGAKRFYWRIRRKFKL